MVQMIKEGAPVTLLPQETPGYMYNIREMLNERNWKRSVFSTEDVLIQLAMLALRLETPKEALVILIFHIVGTVPVITTGLFLFAHEGLRWRDVAKATSQPTSPAD